MTNGELIQKVFNCEVCEPIPEEDIIHVIFPDKNDSAIGFDWSWWNMEHKEPTTKNDLGVDCVARQDVERFIEGFINEYTPEEELEFINLELDGLKHLPPATPQEPIIDKIRAEISEYGSIWVQYQITGRSDKDIEQLVSGVLKQAKEQVLEIIDKYKAESEK